MSSAIVHFERYRRERNQVLRRPAERPLESPFRRYDGGPERMLLNDRQIAHRRQMLDHLARQTFAASCRARHADRLSGLDGDGGGRLPGLQ